MRKRLKQPITYKHPVFYALYALVFAVIGYFIYRAFAAPPATPSIYLTPSAQTFPANTTFTVGVRESSGATTVNAVQANLSYPAALLDIVSIDYTGSAFSIQAESTGANGSIVIARGTTTPVSGDQLIATITFKTKLTGGNAAVAFTAGSVLLSSTNNTNILGSLSATYGGTYAVDVAPPTVAISTPTNGSTVSAGGTTAITATAADNSAVSNVVILIDGVARATLTSSPYTYNWGTAGLALGAHTIQATARDPYGNTASSPVVTVTLADTTPPTTSITAPTNGSTVSGTTTISTSASDGTGGTGVNRVEFFVDGALVGTDTSSPYAYAWDTRTKANGSTHSLTTKAYDNAATVNSTTSGVVSVVVDNADRTAPSTPGNLTVSGRTQTSVTLSWTASTDAVGVTGYRIRRGGTVVTTTNAATLSFTVGGLTTGTSYSFDVSAVDAAGNFSTPATVNGSTVAKVAGDANNDNVVNVFDLSILLADWTKVGTSSDLNGDNVVNVFDLSIMLANWGKTG